MSEVDPIEVDQETVQSMMTAGAQVVDVLGQKEYERIHLAGAIHLPLAKLDRQTVGVLQREQPVIVYCYDYQ